MGAALRGARHFLAVREDIAIFLHLRMDQGDRPALPLRSTHAAWMEGVPADFDSVGGAGERVSHADEVWVMKSSDSQYWVAFDHVRAFAALTVFVWHFMHGQQQNGYPVPFEGAPFIPPLAILDEGHTGVAIFMTLSGYLFAKLLDGKDIIYRQFYLNRALRLFPLLILVAALKAVDMALFNYGDFHLYGKSLISGFVLPDWPNGGWSIAVELHFYLILPFILFLARRNSNFLLLILATAIIFRTGLYLSAGTVHHLAYSTIFGRIDQFVLGVYFFIRRDWLANRVQLTIGILLVFYIVFWLFNNAGGFYQLGGIMPSQNVIWVFLPTLEGFAYATAIACYDRNMRFGTGKISAVWAEYGKFSYSIYLLHFFVVFRVAEFINERLISIENVYLALPFGVILFLAMYPVSWLSYRFIEEPFLQFRKRYTAPRTPQKVLIQ